MDNGASWLFLFFFCCLFILGQVWSLIRFLCIQVYSFSSKMNQRRSSGWSSNSNRKSPDQQNQDTTSTSTNGKGRSSYIKKPGGKGWSSMGVGGGSGSGSSQDASIVGTSDGQSRPSPIGRSPATPLPNVAVRHNVKGWGSMGVAGVSCSGNSQDTSIVDTSDGRNRPSPIGRSPATTLSNVAVRRNVKGWSSMGVAGVSCSRNSQDASIVDTSDVQSRPSPIGRSPATTLSNVVVRRNVCAPDDNTSSKPVEPLESGQDEVMLHSSSKSSTNKLTQPRKTSPTKEYNQVGQDEVILDKSPECCTDRIPGARKASPKRESSCSNHVAGEMPTITPFDICPKKHKTVVLKPSFFETNSEKRKDIARSMQGRTILRPGMVHLRNFITHDDQIKIIKECQKLGVGHGGFYKPGYRDGAKLSLEMMCLGKTWDPQTRSYEESRSIDGAKPPTIPTMFKEMVSKAIEASHDILREGRIRNPSDAIPLMEPDVCIVNFYSQSGKLGLHQDKDESPESLKSGLPVVSFSIGDSAEFLYGDDRDADKAKKVELKSGDVLVFGGKSRHIFHGVPSIVPDSAPRFLADEADFRPGRLNLTFRKY